MQEDLLEQSGEQMVLRVGQFLSLVNDTLVAAFPARTFVVEGEVSDVRISQGKWVYFDLKDEKEEALMKCFMTVWQMKTPLENGMRVRVQGYPKLYERFGTFSLNVQEVEPVGEGALQRAYELLKKKLEQEGLFDASRKRVLKRFPERIGLITSRDAAAYGDFMRILNNRWGGVEIMHAHAHVQGAEAVRDIVGAFRYFNQLSEEDRPDALVLTRGGGGLEDLHAFNDERTARAVYQSAIPVVCAVGHERDESLCDFVADVRASTPSNAAERLVPSREEVSYEIDSMARHIEGRITDQLRRYERVVDHAVQATGFLLEREKTRFEMVLRRLMGCVDDWIPNLQQQVVAHERLLKQVDPKRILARGFSIALHEGKVVTDPSELDNGDELTLQLARGQVLTEVKKPGASRQQRLMEL